MPLTVRSATPADAAVIADYNYRLAEESEGKALDRPTLAAGVVAVLADPAKGRYFVAEDGGAVVGQLLLTLEWSDWRNGWIWWVQSVYVRAESRRQGAFRALYRHVIEAARADPTVVGLRLYVERENERAQRTYESLGLERTSYFVMERIPL